MSTGRGGWARRSEGDQTAENQLLEPRRYVDARGWTAVEYVDTGASGAKDRRSGLDRLVADVRRHRVQGIVCWRLDRLGRNLRHIVTVLDDWQARGVTFVTIGGVDTSTSGGRLVAGVHASIAEFERARIQERIHAGLARARAQSKMLGRRRSGAARSIGTCAGLSHAEAAERPGVSIATVKRWRRSERLSHNRPWRSPSLRPCLRIS
jgi:DNA invertase Pin-like site-specific DNA recombinase